MILIVGGGVIGLSIAWKLIEIGKKVLILDKNKILEYFKILKKTVTTKN